ncbi:MAG: TRAP transporter small permease [Silicimonas sp.]|uniref:TRAP transporter small permease n=1 Tax=Roseitalea porphyridii TaxID=1852022 RepID=UPI0032EE51FB
MSRLIRFLDRIPFAVAGICLALLVLHVTLDVILSRTLNYPIKYTIEISSYYYMVAIVFLPLANVECQGEHINVDFILKALPARAETCVGAFTSLLGVAVAAFLAYRTGIDALRATKSGEVVMGTGLLVIWPGRWLLPIGFALLAIAMTMRAIQRCCNTPGSTKSVDKKSSRHHGDGNAS